MGRARSSMSIAPPASDSVTNRRELEFSNQILKTKQDGTDRRAERQETAGRHARPAPRSPPQPPPGGAELEVTPSAASQAVRAIRSFGTDFSPSEIMPVVRAAPA